MLCKVLSCVVDPNICPKCKPFLHLLIAPCHETNAARSEVKPSLSLKAALPIREFKHFKAWSFHKVFTFMVRNPVVPRILGRVSSIPHNRFDRPTWELQVSNFRILDVRECSATDNCVAIIRQPCRIPTTQNPFAPKKQHNICTQNVDNFKKGASYSHLFTSVSHSSSTKLATST